MMDWIELNCEVECPKCGYSEIECFQFNMGCADSSGVESELKELQCWECDKKYYARSRMNIETELSYCDTKKPKK